VHAVQLLPHPQLCVTAEAVDGCSLCYTLSNSGVEVSFKLRQAGKRMHVHYASLSTEIYCAMHAFALVLCPIPVQHTDARCCTIIPYSKLYAAHSQSRAQRVASSRVVSWCPYMLCYSGCLSCSTSKHTVCDDSKQRSTLLASWQRQSNHYTALLLSALCAVVIILARVCVIVQNSCDANSCSTSVQTDEPYGVTRSHTWCADFSLQQCRTQWVFRRCDELSSRPQLLRTDCMLYC
jgi:hypothetical protein